MKETNTPTMLSHDHLKQSNVKPGTGTGFFMINGKKGSSVAGCLVLFFLSFISGGSLIFGRLAYSVYKNRIKNEFLLYSASIVSGILVSTIVLFLILYVSILRSTMYTSHKFDSAIWMNEPEKRYKLVKDLDSSEIIINMTVNEVRGLLGQETCYSKWYTTKRKLKSGDYRIDTSDTAGEEMHEKLLYDVGIKKNMNPNIIQIYFSNGKAADIDQSFIRKSELEDFFKDCAQKNKIK